MRYLHEEVLDLLSRALDGPHDATFPLGLRQVPAGERTWLPHRAVNGGTRDALVFLFANVVQGAASLPVFFSDPNGDGGFARLDLHGGRIHHIFGGRATAPNSSVSAPFPKR